MSVLGIVLCAGFGSRLAPLTDEVPKPLVPVANRPVLDLVLDRMAEAGVTAVGINLHHRAESLQEHLRRRQDMGRRPHLRLHYEPQILDTGGGIANFREWLESTDVTEVVVHNSDIVTDIDLHAMIVQHHQTKAEATLALIDQPSTNSVAIHTDGQVVDINRRLGLEATRLLTFSGVYVLSRGFLRRLEPGRKASVLDSLLASMQERSASVRAFLPAPHTYWRDLGQVSAYLDLHREILLAGRFSPPGLQVPEGGILVDAGAHIEPSAKLEGFVAVGAGCHIGSGVRLTNCVVWPGTRLEDDFQATGAVITHNLVVAA